jgi:hypothetical protein
MIVSPQTAAVSADANERQLEFLKPLVNAWIGRIEASSEHRKPWEDAADECALFYSTIIGMKRHGNDDSRFWLGKTSPKFKLIISKAFELVAQIGPSLFFNAPGRYVRPKRLKDLPADIFGDVQNDPQAAQMFQMYQQERSADSLAMQARAQLLQHWLDYTPREQPGGVELHAQRAITEAMIMGRGVLWIEPYRKLGSTRQLTGVFYDSVYNLYIDPDATKVEEIRWMAQRVVEPYREVEERFSLPRDSLKKHASVESNYQRGSEKNNRNSLQKTNRYKQQADLITYYRVWTKNGLGMDSYRYHSPEMRHLNDDVIQTRPCYMVIAPGVPYPLNASTQSFRGGATDEDVQNMFEWPIPYWADDMWPCEFLDFYDNPDSVWPIPPLYPAMSHLKFLNIMMSHLCNRIWMSSRSFIAVKKSVMDEVERIINRGEDLAVLPVSDGMHESIHEMIEFLKQPDVNLDAYHILDRVSDGFEKASGLSDLVYGMSDTQSRSAEDASIKRQGISIRPEYMARQVERWWELATRKEAFCTRWFVTAEDVRPLFGQTGAQLWSMLIDSQDVDTVVREMDYTIAAGSAKRRNKQTELANLNQFMQFAMPEVSKHADITSDTSALNYLFNKWAEAAEMDWDVQLGQRAPPPPPPGTPDPEKEKLKMEKEKHKSQLQTKAQESQVKLAELLQKFQLERAQAAQKARIAQSESRDERTTSVLDMLASQAEHRQSLRQQEEEHDQDLRHQEESHDQDVRLEAEKARVQRAVMKASARAAQQQSNGSDKK